MKCYRYLNFVGVIQFSNKHEKHTSNRKTSNYVTDLNISYILYLYLFNFRF